MNEEARKALDDGARDFARIARQSGYPTVKFYGSTRRGWEVVITPFNYDNSMEEKIAILDDGTWQNIGNVPKRRSWIVNALDGVKYVEGLAGTDKLPASDADAVRKRLANRLIELRGGH